MFCDRLRRAIVKRKSLGVDEAAAVGTIEGASAASRFSGPLFMAFTIAGKRVQYLAREMHAVGASIIVGRRCRFSVSDTLRRITIISLSRSVPTG